MTYANTGAYSVDVNNAKNGSLIMQIKECDGSATPTCLNPMAFTWVPGTVGTNPFATTQAWAGLPAGATVIATGDINGDGRADILYSSSTSAGFPVVTTTNWNYSLSTGTGFTSGIIIGSRAVKNTCVIGTQVTCTTAVVSSSGIQGGFLADINRDGFADLIYGTTVMLSTGNALGVAQTWAGLPIGASITATGDINGDGRADVLYQASTTTGAISSTTVTTWGYAISTGSAYSVGASIGSVTTQTNCSIGTSVNCTTTTTASSGITGGRLADVNGDGLADIISNTIVRLSAGSSFAAAQTWAGLPIGAQVIAVGDINGDGRADAIYKVTGGLNTTDFSVAYSYGNGFANSGVLLGESTTRCTSISFGACIATTVASTTGITSGLLIDINGDGLADVVSGANVSLALTSIPDLLTSISDGIGSITNITQSKLSTAGLYTPDTGSAYPVRDILSSVPMYVVSTATTSDGNGGVLTNTYTYGGLKADMTGRGSLGFRYQNAYQGDTGITTFTGYRQDYPYIGLPSSTGKYQASLPISESYLTYANAPITTGTAVSQFPYLSQSLEKNYELGGVLINTTTTTNQYDSYGNATQISVNSGDGYIKTTTNVYSNDTTNWFLGRLLRSTVTSTTP